MECLWSHLVSPEDRPPWTQNPRLWSDRTQRRTSFLRNGRDARVVLRSSAYWWTAGQLQSGSSPSIPLTTQGSQLMYSVGVSAFLKRIWPVHLMKVYPNYCPLKIHYAHIWVFYTVIFLIENFTFNWESIWKYYPHTFSYIGFWSVYIIFL